MVPLAIDQVLHSVLCRVNSTVASGSCVKLNEMGIWKMNERIRELKRQAMLFAQEKCDGQTTDMRGNLRSDIWTEKFAELIVRECMIVARKADGLDAEHEAWYLIKEHFGVEE